MKSLLPLTLVMAGLALLLSFVAWKREPGMMWEGWKSGLQVFIQILPLLLIALGISGLVRVLIPQEAIAHWLGKESGWRGIFLGCLAGAVTPGGPYTSFPIVAGLFKAGAGLGTLVAYMTAWSLWAVARLPLEIALINKEFAFYRFLSTLIFPPLAGWIAHTCFSRFFTT